MNGLRGFLLLFLVIFSCFLTQFPKKVQCLDPDWGPAEDVLNRAIGDGAFPGCVALVGDASGKILFQKPFGSFTYGIPPPHDPSENPPMKLDTMFDMASCTKVVATTAAAAQFYQRKELMLDMALADPSLLGPQFATKGKEKITVEHCLTHSAGFPPDPVPNYWAAEFGCPQTSQPQPQLDFSCQDMIFSAFLDQELDSEPGTKYVYSDISMFSMMYVVGKLAKTLGYVRESDLVPGCDLTGSDAALQCYFEAYVRIHVFEKLDMVDSGYLPPSASAARCAPTENDTAYLHRVIQGEVSDGNAFASGGIQGHAGLFSTVLDLAKYVPQWMIPKGSHRQLDRMFSDETIKLFRAEVDHGISSRALGWNTNDPTVFDEGWNGTCGDWSAQTFLHIGYTGTQICIDPLNQIFTLLLTNRVYPDFHNVKILEVRKEWNRAVKKILLG